ncbi:MAG: NAD-dependent epimerase/dehydratase [Pseudonocardiales bacterium]|nr:NAD-dependent epimerase/dehydratase [Pseudonocardiales bacterium]
MKAVVTGATGLVGGHVCRALREAGHEARAVVRTARISGPLDRLDVETVRATLDNPASLVAAMRGCDVVIHCAAVYAYGVARAAEVERVNVDGTRQVVTAAAEAGVRRVVVTSSSVTAGSSGGPVARDESGRIGTEYVPPYFISKVRQEEVAFATGAESGVQVVVACPTVVLGGPANRLVPSNAIIVRYLTDPTRSTFAGGCNVVGVEDVARGHVLLAEHGKPGERYLLGGENVSWRTLHSLIADLAGVGGPYAEVPASVALATSALAEKWAQLMSIEPLSTRDEALTIGRYFWYSAAKAAQVGYAFGPARAAIASALAWILIGEHLPRWVRDGLRVGDEVRAARRLMPRPL